MARKQVKTTLQHIPSPSVKFQVLNQNSKILETAAVGGETALMMATGMTKVDCMLLLLEHGASLQTKGNCEKVLLFILHP